MTHFKWKENWSREAVEINLEYLTDNYADACTHKKIKKIREIEFVTTQGSFKKKWYTKARTKLIQLIIILFIISTLINRVVLQTESYGLFLINIIGTAITIIVSHLDIKTVRFVNLRLFSDTWGYYVYSGNRNERLIPRTTIIKKTIFENYFLRMNSLNAFFYIWINYIEKKEEFEKEQYIFFLKWIESIEERNMITYFPVFTIGYFLFEKEIKVAELKKVYNDVVLAEDKKYSFERMLHSQIFYLTRNLNQDIFEYRDKLNLYLCWLETETL